MTYLQRNIPSPNRVFDFSLTTFTGGLNNRSNMPENDQCTDVLNMAFNDDQIMEKRRGTTYFDSMNIDEPVTFIDEFKPYEGENMFIRASDNYFWVDNARIFKTSGRMQGVNFMGKYYFVDSKGLYCFGTFPQASTAPYTEVKGTANVNYMVMQVVSPPDGYTPLPTEHTKGKMVYDYTAQKVWYEPCKNEMDDTFKQGNVVLVNPRYLIIKSSRLFMAGSDREDNSVYISDIDNPFYFPAALGIGTPPDGDSIVGLVQFNDSVVVGRRNDVYHITGSTNRGDTGGELFRLRYINSHTGFASVGAAKVAHNYLLFLGKDGNAYAMNSTLTASGSMATSLISKHVNFFIDPIGLTKPDIVDAQSIFFEDTWYITIKDKVLLYNYRHQAWSQYNNLDARYFYEFEDILLWGDERGMVSMPSEDFLDYGEPFMAHWESKVFDMDDPVAFKMFKNFFIVAHAFEGYDSDIYLLFSLDHALVNEEIVIDNKIAKWGEASFGDSFTTKSINASTFFLINKRARGIRFRYRNGFDVIGSVASLDELQAMRGTSKFTTYKVDDEGAYYAFLSNGWTKLELIDYNQPMRLYQVNGEYEMRRKR